MLEFRPATLQVSPEFSFPIQLIYQTSHTGRGLLGDHWFIPQLESRVVPHGRGVLVWTQPSGGMIALRQSRQRAHEYTSFDGEWNGRISGESTRFTSSDRWTYAYNRGRLQAVTSPTGRILEAVWTRNQLSGLQVRDREGAAPLVLVSLKYNEARQLDSMEVNGTSHRFGYEQSSGKTYRLTDWKPPAGDPIRFIYDPQTGVLARTIRGDGATPESIADYKTEFVRPFNGRTPSQKSGVERDPANHWLIEDPSFTYTYGRDSGNPEKWDSESIQLTSRTGLVQDFSRAAARGMQTAKEGGLERVTYFHRAPGQRYDGKLRRIEENGRLLVEYRYDRRTGLLSERIDENGLITFYDYPEKAGRQGPELGRAGAAQFLTKPIRLREGTRRNNVVVAEFAYNDFGLLTAARDREGNTTQVTYNRRGEIETATGPDGIATRFAYDPLGRRTTVMRGDLREVTEYEPTGRLKARIGTDGSRTEFKTNALGQVEAVVRDGELITESLRDEAGKLVGERDPLGRVKQVEFDHAGNLLAEILPDGSTTRYEYDAFNRRIAQIDGNGNRIDFEYDPAGRMLKQTNAIGHVLANQFDSRGRLIQRNNGEQIIRNSYDASGRLSRVDYGGGQTIDYAHDGRGRILSAISPDSSFINQYDSNGRLMAVRMVQRDNEYLLQYRHDTAGRRTGLILARLIQEELGSGGRAGRAAGYDVLQQVDYKYDQIGRLAQLRANGFPILTIEYDATGRPARRVYGAPDAPEIVSTVGHDAQGRLRGMEFSGKHFVEPVKLGYEWDAASQVTRRAWNGETHRYEYCPAGRLISVLDDATSRALEKYRYDAAANMILKSIGGRITAMQYNAGNQLTAMRDLPKSLVPDGKLDMESALHLLEHGADSIWKSAEQEINSIAYDRAGRMLGNPGEEKRTYGWLDKLTSLERPDGTRTTFTYWPDGQLATTQRIEPQITQINTDSIRQVSNSAIENRKPSAARQPATLSSNIRGQSKFENYLWDGLALLMRDGTVYVTEPHPSGGIPVASYPVGKPHEITWHLNDLLGTTLATVQGTAVEFTRLTAFGAPAKTSEVSATTLDASSNLAPRAPPVPPDIQQPPTTNTP